MRRLQLLAPLVLVCAALAACGGATGELSTGDGLDQGVLRVRVMAGNLTSGTRQSYDPGEGIRIFQGLKPDVALVQETNYGTNSDADLRAFVDRAFGTGFAMARECCVQIPNAVVSRWPIVASGNWQDPYVGNRSFSWARIQLPGVSKNLWAVSVHLLTSSQGSRQSEAAALVEKLRQTVPSGDYIVVGGDFNTSSRTEPALQTFGQIFDVAGPYPADARGVEGTNASRAKPYDWVLASTSLRPYQTSVVVGGSLFPAGLVVDSRVYSPLDEISPAQSADSGASNMQHMGVVKDFLVPLSATSRRVAVTVPNGGETWPAGTTQQIRWTGSEGAVRVEVSTGGAAWTSIGTSSGGSLSWTVPATASSSARIRVTETGGSGLTDSSDGTFSITVPAPQPVGGDVFEPDDSAAAAMAIEPNGASQLHDISSAADQDWVTFTLAATKTVRIATDGPYGGDTFVTLYDSAQRQLAYDDDSGPGYYSLLTRSLSAGTYMVKVTSYRSATTIKGYSLRVTAE